ncbi:CBS domain-containing protein [Flavilitoribacter nigricans]|uniref:Inosine-5-monophosphate dehydrogenase n=1 Tax=Flavilitoribacter nigricans (strain ATCC 23147 / DSM 23189 / NBRC 102662 / NCIMB 1420 / SS-2) TaxID=1122177 RepID=A0A2D0N444_FLAN2|nr:CBS domain-containing protein [Flavilitoribacter nigricans]PHN03322.1 inosine-5-monophosphate dehydrogenase [Flavilitoribacter nigricans DSM 23189 = NBRC 102662]
MKNYQQKPVERTDDRTTVKAPSVSDYMVRDLITFQPDTAIMEVIKTLLGKNIAGAPVLNSRKELVGLIDDKDCLRVLFDSSYHNQPVNKNTVSDYMTNVMRTISAHADIFEVADIFLSTKYKRLLVVDDQQRLIGQISRQDILRAIHDIHTLAR